MNPPVRVAQHGDLLEPAVLPQGVGVRAQLLEGDRRRGWSARAAVAAVVVVDQVQHVPERVEPGVQRGVVASQPAVHDQAG
jgi:hypothetical protein